MSSKPSSTTSFPPNAITSSASVFSRMPLENVLEDLASRFILNLPIVELSQIERVCFQVEQAHWFYEDFVRPNSLLNLPSYHLKTFTGLFFEKCEFLTIDGAPLAGWHPQTAYEKFLRYKERVPVCGAIMFNEDANQVLLVRGFKSGSSWSFPRGKINENELPRDCAIREVLEETGFNIEPYLSLSADWSDDSKSSAIRKIRPTNPTPSGQAHKSHQSSTLHTEGQDHFIEITIREQRLRMYLVTGIPNDTTFVTQTRQEIGSIAWFPLSNLPTFSASSKHGDKQLSKMIHSSTGESDSNHRSNAKFYMVVPFVNDIRTWLTTNHLLTPVGQPLLTPRAEHHYPYVQSPNIPLNQDQYGHRTAHPKTYTNGFDSHAAAVHERVGRLEAFDFFQNDTSSAPPKNPDTRLPSSNKKKKKRQQQQQQRKSSRGGDHVYHPMGDSSHHSDQQLSTDEEEIQVNDTPWNDLEEGTRALQNFFFGSQSEEPCSEDGYEPMLDVPSFASSKENSGSTPFPSSRPHLDLYHQDQHAKQHVYVPQQDTNQLGRPLDSDEPLSEADTDVVKGYDIATSYASSMSSSYRGASTHIPSSSDEQNTPTQPAKSNHSTMPSQFVNMPSNLVPTNDAEVMYSKHGHLAAPRPQPAPQQVERLLAMLQAPTPVPATQTHSSSLLSQLMNSAQKEAEMKAGISHQPNQESRAAPSPFSSLQISRSHSRAHASYHHSISTQPQSTTSSDPALSLDRASSRMVTPAEPVTPRANNLLELLIKGSSSSSPSSAPVVNQTHHQTSELSVSHDPSGHPANEAPNSIYHNHHPSAGSNNTNRVPLGEEERKEKKEALLRQLHCLASLSINPSAPHPPSAPQALNHPPANPAFHHHHHRIAID